MLLSGPWPPKIGEHLAVRTQKGLRTASGICEFLGFCPGITQNEGNLRVKVYQKYSLNVPNNMSLWQDNDSIEYLIDKANVLPVRPMIEVVPSLSRMTRSGRQVIFQVENMDVIESMGNEND